MRNGNPTSYYFLGHSECVYDNDSNLMKTNEYPVESMHGEDKLVRRELCAVLI